MYTYVSLSLSLSASLSLVLLLEDLAYFSFRQVPLLTASSSDISLLTFRLPEPLPTKHHRSQISKSKTPDPENPALTKDKLKIQKQDKIKNNKQQRNNGGK